MKLKMLTSMSGPLFALSAGDETEMFSDAEAARFIEAGIAILAPETEIGLLRDQVAALDGVAAAYDLAKAANEDLEGKLAAALAENVTLTTRVSDLETALSDADDAAKADAGAAATEIKILGDRLVELETALAAKQPEEAGEKAVKPKAAEKRG